MNKKIRLERLRELKYMLDNHSKLFKEIKFNIDTWYSPTDSCSVSGGCGTAACALGSAASHKPFNKKGLKLASYRNIYMEPEYKGSRNFMAGQMFFGISSKESLYLFQPGWYQYGSCMDLAATEYNLSGKTKRQLKLEKAIQDVKPRHVSARVQVLIDHYTNSNEPLLGVQAA